MHGGPSTINFKVEVQHGNHFYKLKNWKKASEHYLLAIQEIDTQLANAAQRLPKANLAFVINVLFVAIDCHLHLNEFSEATRLIDQHEVILDVENEAKKNLLRAKIFIGIQRRAQAIDCLQDSQRRHVGLPLDSDAVESVFLLSNCYLEDKEFEKSAGVVVDIKTLLLQQVQSSSGSESPFVKYLLQANFHLGVIARAQGNANEAEGYFSEARAVYNRYVYLVDSNAKRDLQLMALLLHAEMITCYHTLGKIEDCLPLASELESLLEIVHADASELAKNKVASALLMSVKLYFQAGQVERAHKLMNKLLTWCSSNMFSIESVSLVCMMGANFYCQPETKNYELASQFIKLAAKYQFANQNALLKAELILLQLIISINKKEAKEAYNLFESFKQLVDDAKTAASKLTFVDLFRRHLPLFSTREIDEQKELNQLYIDMLEFTMLYLTLGDTETVRAVSPVLMRALPTHHRNLSMDSQTGRAMCIRRPSK